MGNRTSNWIEPAGRLPIAFAQVREDPLLDIAALQRIGASPRVAMIASGGCTAAALAAFGGIRSIHLVDPNPAQLALSRFKLLLLAEADPRTRRALLGHEALDPAERRSRICALLERLNLSDQSLGPIEQVAQKGPDFLGRYERLFAALQEALLPQRQQLQSLLSKAHPSRENDQPAPSSRLGKALDEAMDEVLSLPNLVGLFGQEATRNPVLPFSRFFAGRVRAALATSSVAENPWLWQMLLGRFPPAAAYPWLDATTPGVLPAVTWGMCIHVPCSGGEARGVRLRAPVEHP